MHPRIVNCVAGMRLDYLNAESFDGIHVMGGVFISNVNDLLVPNTSGLRPTNFVGTWFETSSKGIISITNKNSPKIVKPTVTEQITAGKISACFGANVSFREQFVGSDSLHPQWLLHIILGRYWQW